MYAEWAMFSTPTGQVVTGSYLHFAGLFIDQNFVYHFFLRWWFKQGYMKGKMVFQVCRFQVMKYFKGFSTSTLNWMMK